MDCRNNRATKRGRCYDRRREYERERSARRRNDDKQGRAVQVHHSKRWAMVRKDVLARDPVCKVCDERLSTRVDQIVAMRDGGGEYDPAALQGLCTDCHRRKSAREAAARR
jgi:5-methylcytosine-specific restriction endonuclease McrA